MQVLWKLLPYQNRDSDTIEFHINSNNSVDQNVTLLG